MILYKRKRVFVRYLDFKAEKCQNRTRYGNNQPLFFPFLFLTSASTSLLNVSITYSSLRLLISMPTLCQCWVQQQGEGGSRCARSSWSGGQGWRKQTAEEWSRCSVQANTDTHRWGNRWELSSLPVLSFIFNLFYSHFFNNFPPFPRLQSCCWSKAPTSTPLISRVAVRSYWLPLRATWARLSSCCPMVRVHTFHSEIQVCSQNRHELEKNICTVCGPRCVSVLCWSGGADCTQLGLHERPERCGAASGGGGSRPEPTRQTGTDSTWPRCPKWGCRYSGFHACWQYSAKHVIKRWLAARET